MKFLIVISVLAFALTAADDGGFVKIHNRGLYVAIFSVSYDLNGKPVSKSSGPFWMFHHRTIEIPEGATNIRVKAEEYWFFKLKATIFEEQYDKPGSHCYKVYGVTFAPTWKKKEFLCAHISFGSNDD